MIGVCCWWMLETNLVWFQQLQVSTVCITGPRPRFTSTSVVPATVGGAGAQDAWFVIQQPLERSLKLHFVDSRTGKHRAQCVVPDMPDACGFNPAGQFVVLYTRMNRFIDPAFLKPSTRETHDGTGLWMEQRVTTVHLIDPNTGRKSKHHILDKARPERHPLAASNDWQVSSDCSTLIVWADSVAGNDIECFDIVSGQATGRLQVPIEEREELELKGIGVARDGTLVAIRGGSLDYARFGWSKTWAPKLATTRLDRIVRPTVAGGNSSSWPWHLGNFECDPNAEYVRIEARLWDMGDWDVTRTVWFRPRTGDLQIDDLPSVGGYRSAFATQCLDSPSGRNTLVVHGLATSPQIRLYSRVGEPLSDKVTLPGTAATSFDGKLGMLDDHRAVYVHSKIAAAAFDWLSDSEETREQRVSWSVTLVDLRTGELQDLGTLGTTTDTSIEVFPKSESVGFLISESDESRFVVRHLDLIRPTWIRLVSVATGLLATTVCLLRSRRRRRSTPTDDVLARSAQAA